MNSPGPVERQGANCPAASTNIRPWQIARAFFFPGWPGIVVYRNTNQLNDVDAAYIAGLIDGEGTVTLTRKHRNENRQLAVTVSNTDSDLLEYLLDTVGAGKITGKRTARTHHTPSFTYALYNRQALSLLQQVTPFLRTYKAERASRIHLRNPPAKPRGFRK